MVELKNNLNDEVKKKSKEMLDKIKTEKKLDIENIVVDDDFTKIANRCCENILGYLKMPLGVTKEPIIVNGHKFYMPFCTTEGALVASVCRGIKLTNMCGGIEGFVENIGITRSFAIQLPDFKTAIKCYKWLKTEEVISLLKYSGNNTSRYLKVKSIETKHVIGCIVYIKVYAYTGDAMGMNMITKACNQMSAEILSRFKNSHLACISANICTDKKWSIENYCNGRGRRVFLNISISNENCKSVLKVDIYELYKVYKTKIVIGSALVLGNFNCQAANYITAIFIALGQDTAQAIESSNCMISMEIKEEVLYVSLWMPSLVVGILGGGTHLKPQSDFLKQFKLEDSQHFLTDRNLDNYFAPNYLALAISSAVLCGELSALAALADNSLIDAHMKLNRKK